MTVWPTGTTSPGKVSSEYGPRKAPTAGASTFHLGIDEYGFTYNHSPAAGVVIFARYNGGGGNEVRVRAANGDQFYMKHNASFLVKEGQTVAEGQRVGVQGRTGNVTGVHVHFECHPGGGVAVNPRIYMAAAIANNGGGGSAPAGVGNAIINRLLGIQYVTALQKQLGVTADGDAGVSTIKALQAKIGTPVDGDFGANSVKALQRFVGLTDVDGDWGNNTTNAVRAAIDAGKFGSAAPANPNDLTGIALERAKGMKGELGADYVAELQKQLGIGIDGLIGRGTVEALQRKVGASPVDGDFGPGSISKLQSFIGLTGADVDGVWGVGTTAAVKRAINEARFTPGWTPPVVEPPVVVPPAASLERTTKSIAANRRKYPTTDTPSIEPSVPADTKVTIKTYTKGQAVTGNDIWYRLADDTFAWSGGFTSQSIEGVPLEVVEAPPAPTLPDGAVYGIDVAWPQTGAFDWAKVAEDNEFVIIKAAGAETGIYGPADLLDKHLAGARSVDLPVGFYFFNNGALPIEPQAAKFVEILTPRIRPGDIVALDIENDGTTVPQFTPAQALEFAGYVEKALGIKTFMYINRATMNNGDWSKVVAAGHPLWLATLAGLGTSLATPIKHWPKASIVQFEVGTIEGYTGQIDRNYGFLLEMSLHGFEGFPEEPGEEEPPVEEPDTDYTELAGRVTALEGAVARLIEVNEQLRKALE